jgi:hypothetical protein
MAPSVTLNRRLSTVAAAAALLFFYETARLANQHLRWVPGTDAPQWARIVFHASIGGMAVALCAACAARVIASMQVHISPSLSGAKAREAISSRALRGHLPKLPQASFTLELTELGDWHLWRTGAVLFLITALPYWLLIAMVGHVVAFGIPYLAIQAWRLFSWPVAGGFLLLWLASLAARGLNRAQPHTRPRAPDRAALTIIAFAAGAESWSTRERWQACVLYSLWLQSRMVFPVLTALTAVPSHRFMLTVYCRQVWSGRSPDEALSHLFSIRVARLVTALAFYSSVTLIKVRTHIW